MATCSDRDNEFLSALVLRIIYTDEGYTVSGSHGEMTMWWLFYFLLRDAACAMMY